MSGEQPSSPPGREVVVVRAGPPKKRGALVDAAVGVLGVALLVVAGVLGETLPEEDFVPIQYLPEFPMNNTDALIAAAGSGETPERSKILSAGTGTAVPEGEEFRYDVFVEHDNVVGINFQVVIPDGDDIPSSLQDSFTFELLRPDGTREGEPWKVNTEPSTRRDPTPDPTDPGSVDPNEPLYVSPQVVAATSWRMGAPPEPDFIDSSEAGDATMALSLAIDEYTIETKGTWGIVFRLNAGDCPGPSASDQERFLECQRETSGTEDPSGDQRGIDDSNDLTLKSIRYDYYVIEVPDPRES